MVQQYTYDLYIHVAWPCLFHAVILLFSTTQYLRLFVILFEMKVCQGLRSLSCVYCLLLSDTQHSLVKRNKAAAENLSYILASRLCLLEQKRQCFFDAVGICNWVHLSSSCYIVKKVVELLLRTFTDPSHLPTQPPFSMLTTHLLELHLTKNLTDEILYIVYIVF